MAAAPLIKEPHRSLLDYAGVRRGGFPVTLTAYAQGYARQAQIITHCAPATRTKQARRKSNSDPSLAGVFGRKSGAEPRL